MLTVPDRRLIVLTGPGGVGKTRLAMAVAERTRREWPDGAAFVDLSPVSDPELVPDAIASALWIRNQVFVCGVARCYNLYDSQRRNFRGTYYCFP